MGSGGFAAAAVCALTSASLVSAPVAYEAHAAIAADDHSHGQQTSSGQAAHRGAGGGTKTVRYLGYTFRVPARWPVLDNRAHPRACVRFDQHAVYLGAVPAGESCPSWLLGTTESILIQPGPSGSARSAAENPVSRQVIARAPGIAVFATFDTDPTVIYRILASARLPSPSIEPISPSRLSSAEAAAWPSAAAQASAPAGTATGAAARSARLLRRPMGSPPLPSAVTSYRGLGFDACAAPSRATMAAWHRSSPYRAIGIYVGGADRACAQPNLSQAWVRAEAGAGWRFIPLYAGPQAAFGQLQAPARQGWAAAQDAVAQMRRLGFGRRTPVYYDMEAFRPRSRILALRFLSAWTIELHRLGYASGVYSSSDSGVVDLSQQYSTHVYAMPNIIYDALWNGVPTTTDRNLRTGQWHNERIHQFSGNVTQRFGGHTINIDKDVLDVRVGAAAATAQSTSAVTLPGGAVDVFYRLRDEIWFDRYRPGPGWGRPARTGSASSSAPSAVWTGSAVDVFYKGAGGHLWVGFYRPDGRPAGRSQLSAMGVLGSGPRAIAQADGVIDVFWRGSADDHLWHGQFLPGSGWNGPQGLGGALASTPSPVESAPGTTTVLWKGADKTLWYVARGESGHWSPPRSVGMGPLGGQPQATAQPNGDIQVYWHGAGNSRVWEGFYRPGTGWRGPRDLGGQVQSVPWPVTAAGTVRVLWRGPGHTLGSIIHRSGGGWNLAGWQRPALAHLGWLGSAPFAAVGGPGDPLRVFWQGRKGALWTVGLTHGAWSRPSKLDR